MDKQTVSKYIESNDYVPASFEKLSEHFKVSPENYDDFYKILSSLEDDGVIIVGKKDRIFSSKKLGFVSGIFKSTSRGFGFVLGENGDVFIPREKTYGALDGDSVLIRTDKKSKKKQNRTIEGEVVRILKRAKRNIVGTFKSGANYAIIVPDSDKLPEIFVSSNNFCGALNGQKVTCEIIEYESPTTSLTGRVKEILGFPNDFGVDILSVIKKYGFETEFPKKVLKSANSLEDINESDLEGRISFLDDLVITIDGADTKDIDDAVSIRENENSYTLCVHIADVSNYVKTGDALDVEAFSRGTSVYLADRVLPMLPVKLSNGLCSLNEGELRLTMTAVMEIDKDGNLIKSSFCKSYIKSAHKMTYDDVWSILGDGNEDLSKKYKDALPTLKSLYSLAKKLEKKSQNRGTIDFNIPEAKAILNDDGKAVDIVLRETNFAHKMIEEFMVLANSAVAKFLSENEAPAIYRVHENPNEQKLESVRKFLYNAGYKKLGTIKNMLSLTKETPLESVVSTMLLRSMAKAKYSSDNLGHFGLALSDYCHFTSPIRRYPDLVCHRALKAIIEKDEKMLRKLSSFVSEASDASSEREYSATLTERDTLDIKKAEYMESFIGSEFEGVISSITEFGFFVALPNTVEGLVRIESIRGDYYVYSERDFSLTGKRTARTFKLGDVVKVRLVSCDKSAGKIDFELTQGGSYSNGRQNGKKNTRAKQNSSSRVFHRRKNRGRH